MAKRGMLVEAVHFHSYPYTSERAEQKVIELAEVIASYCGELALHIVNLLPVQEQIAANCPEEETTILTRRFMMKIAEALAKDNGCDALITGESLGQVASQTAQAIAVTDEAAGMPVMRPLIAMDKVDIIKKAREIGTFDISIQPYEDCCTVFLPKHPLTKPRLLRILASESKLDAEGLVKAVLESKRTVKVK
jgi:thiamine biosynthesis protein ThiI